jgi:hypothetical protein
MPTAVGFSALNLKIASALTYGILPRRLQVYTLSPDYVLNLFSSPDLLHWGFYFNIITITSWLICVGSTYVRSSRRRSLTTTCWCHDGRNLWPYVLTIIQIIRTIWTELLEQNNLSFRLEPFIHWKCWLINFRKKEFPAFSLRYAKGGWRVLAEYPSKGQVPCYRALSIQYNCSSLP